MNERKASSTYRRVAVESADPAQVLEVLFDRALLECHRAKERIAARDAEGKGRAIGKALEIVNELEAALNHAAAPELAENLARLYTFIVARLQKATVALHAGPIGEAERILATLKDAFAAAARASSGEKP